MLYKSTRGGERDLTFADVLMSAYAKDGGLYVPSELPMFSFETLLEWSTLTFPQVCAEVLFIYTGLQIAIKICELKFIKFYYLAVLSTQTSRNPYWWKWPSLLFLNSMAASILYPCKWVQMSIQGSIPVGRNTTKRKETYQKKRLARICENNTT